MAFEHKDRRAPAQSVRVLLELLRTGLLRANRGWARLLSAHARRIATQRDGAAVLAQLVDADPDGWRLAVIPALASISGQERADLLAAIVRNANRQTTVALARVEGLDVADACRSLQMKQAPRLFIRLMGPLVVHRASPTGPAIAISKKRMKSMLGVLAAHIGRPLSRDQVIETLWPDADFTSGVNNLNQTVFQLRRELDPAHREGESTPYVVSTAESVYLHPALVQTDLGEIRRQAARLNDGPRALRRSAADAILDLLRGEYLMDLRYETWTAPLQVGVHAELRELLRPLLHADGIDITHETGIRAACALLTIDEFDENAHFALIRHLAASGKRQAARAVAERYVGRLRSEFDEEPGSTLVELLNSLGPNVNKPLTPSSSKP